jgi:aryl-alcohol dehydrogenase-like predicted oxidoreductase
MRGGAGMRYRLLGRAAALRVSEVALGTGKFGRAVSPEQAQSVLGSYADAGGRFIDTAVGYQGGESEKIVGRFVGSQRDDFVIGTKWAVGMMRDEPFPGRGTSRKAMTRSVEASLRRLGTDYIDVLWTHGFDRETPVEEIMAGFDQLVTAGKILYAGLGTHPAWKVARAATIAELRGWTPLAAITTEYGAAERDAERELLPAAEAIGFGVVAWSPLGGGFLARTGLEGTSPASHLPHWTNAGRPTARDLTVHAAVHDVARQLAVAPAAVGYAWLLDRARHSTTSIVPVMAASSSEQLRQSLRALDLELNDEQRHSIDTAGDPELGEPHVHNLDSDPLYFPGEPYPPAIRAA